MSHSSPRPSHSEAYGIVFARAASHEVLAYYLFPALTMQAHRLENDSPHLSCQMTIP